MLCVIMPFCQDPRVTRPMLGLVVCLLWSCSFCSELWAGETVVLEKALPIYRRPGRPISVSAVPFCPDIDIWRYCRFIGARFRSLCALPGGCGIGAGFGTLVGRSAVIDLLPGRENRPQKYS